MFDKPTPTPTPKPGITLPIQELGLNPNLGKKTPTPTPTPGLHLNEGNLSDLAKALKKNKTPTPTPTPAQLTDEQKKGFDELLKKKTPTPTATVDPKLLKDLPLIIIPPSPTPKPKPDGNIHVTPQTPTPPKIIIPPFKLVTPTATPTATTKVGPGLKYVPPDKGPDKKDSGKGKGNGGLDAWLNLDVIPPLPTQLGPPLLVPNIPPPQAVPPSQVTVVPTGAAPIPESYVPPAPDAPVEVSQTALRASNGQEKPELRAFDQTRVHLVAAENNTMPWQFYWKTTGPAAQAARWEIATVPFVGGYTEFPPAGLVGYGDASVDAESPLAENFFSVDFGSFSANFPEGAVPKKYYMRVVPVDMDGNPVGKPSNFVRIDLP